MEEINIYTTLCLIDNLACTRSVDNEIAFHCFVENCTFETTNLGELLEHLDSHNEKWSGFCCACNEQIQNPQGPLLQELLHLTNCRRNEKGINVVFQPGNKLKKLQEAVDIARAKRLDSYEESDDQSNSLCLKPWNNATLKPRDHCRKKLRKLCLYALYKCMDKNCAFFTSCARNMLIHLENHEKCAVNGAIADLSWLECAYCDLASDNRSSLVQHIREEHSSSAYQCPYCFYRSRTPCHVIYHLETFHVSRPKSILVCREKELHSVERTVVLKNQSKHVFPLRCSDDDCNEITYLMDNFINHLKAAHGNHFKCQFCGLSIPISGAIQHLSTHSIGVYGCIYCRYGANDIDSIRNHMCHTHPSRLPHICVRLTRKNRFLCDEELTSIGSTLICNLSEDVDSKWLKMCPFTNEELLNGPQCLSIVEPNPRPQLDFSDDSKLVSNDATFDDQDILNYNDLITNYSSNDWNEYFDTNRLLQNDNMMEGQMDVDEAFDDLTCTSTTVSDRSELQSPLDSAPDSIKDEHISDDDLIIDVVHGAVEYKDKKRDSGFSITDDDNSRSKRSTTPNTKATKMEINSINDDQSTKHIDPKLSDIFRYRCFYCTEVFANPQLVYQHWEETHAKPNGEFMFEIVKIFKCLYCRHCSIYDELKQKHVHRRHPNETFAIIDKINQRKCALCTVEFCDASTQPIADHFKQHHNIIGMNNTIRLESYLTDEWLEQIIAERIIRRSGPISSQITYGCPHCPSERNQNQSEMVAHIRKHFIRFKCNCCNRSFDRMGLLEKHFAIVHAKGGEALNAVTEGDDDNLGNYLEMKMIFPNGLMLTKRECVNTTFGAMEELGQMVQKLNDSDPSIEHKQQIQTQSEQPLPEAKPKATMKRKQSPVASNSPKPKSRCVDADDVGRGNNSGRRRAVGKGIEKNGSPTITYGITTRQRSRENNNR